MKLNKGTCRRPGPFGLPSILYDFFGYTNLTSGGSNSRYLLHPSFFFRVDMYIMWLFNCGFDVDRCGKVGYYWQHHFKMAELLGGHQVSFQFQVRYKPAKNIMEVLYFCVVKGTVLFISGSLPPPFWYILNLLVVFSSFPFLPGVKNQCPDSLNSDPDAGFAESTSNPDPGQGFFMTKLKNILIWIALYFLLNP